MLAKTSIKRREQIISDKQQEISEKQQELSDLKTETERQIAQLEKRYKDIASELKKTKSEVKAEQRKLANAKRKKEQLVQEMQQNQAKFEQDLKDMKEKQKKQARAERKKLEAKLKKQKMSAKAREKKLKELRSQQEAKFSKQLASLNKKVKSNQKELKSAKARLNARKKLAAKIQSNFKKAGIDAQVDGQTGDVVINFGDEYFDTGKYTLKPGMKNILQKSIPVYAKSLFADKGIADKLSYVEIVGFASPTYGGKYIDPQSMDKKDRKAIEYNLDLSYKRAKSIFTNISDISFNEKKKLKSLIKVTGRSFLTEKLDGVDRNVASGMSRKEFCKLYDCKKAQRVIIKFDVEN
jgi:outer membrane protein OmpA-like peptidoglycan-associated protein